MNQDTNLKKQKQRRKQSDSNAIVKKICRLLSRVLKMPLKNIFLNARLHMDLSADDLDLVEAMMRLEDYYGIEIKDEEYEAFKKMNGSVSDLINLVQKKL